MLKQLNTTSIAALSLSSENNTYAIFSPCMSTIANTDHEPKESPKIFRSISEHPLMLFNSITSTRPFQGLFDGRALTSSGSLVGAASSDAYTLTIQARPGTDLLRAPEQQAENVSTFAMPDAFYQLQTTDVPREVRHRALFRTGNSRTSNTVRRDIQSGTQTRAQGVAPWSRMTRTSFGKAETQAEDVTTQEPTEQEAIQQADMQQPP
ncbi:hypothetical protein BJY04DRAFT_89140 [Aspergillus karnatakaensis]|uniref:uncharacterized protein n=1 Tax=Aspergillus karnatakaensis TaxID=1810916 RepID=UPI003CCCE6CE